MVSSIFYSNGHLTLVQKYRIFSRYLRRGSVFLSMMKNLKTRCILALLIMLAFVLSSSLLYLKSLSVPGSFKLNSDRISLYEKRFKGLRETLPARGAIGYVSDMPVGLSSSDIRELKRDSNSENNRIDIKKLEKANKDYVWFQYIVSPRVVYPGTSQKHVVGNFSTPDIDYRDYIADHFALVEDYGNGVMLFEDSTR